jgi:hypothetical protein
MGVMFVFLSLQSSHLSGITSNIKSDATNRLPVYVLNALYLAPITLWTYLNYGRPMTPEALKVWIKERENSGNEMVSHDMTGHMHMMQQMGEHAKEPPEKDNHHAAHESHDMIMGSGDSTENSHMDHGDDINHAIMEQEAKHSNVSSVPIHRTHVMSGHKHVRHEELGHKTNTEKGTKVEAPSGNHRDAHTMSGQDHMSRVDADIENKKGASALNHAGHTMEHMQHETGGHNMAHMNHDMSNDPHMFNMMRDRPMFATVTVAVCHCGAGCLLGDIVGEWLVYATNAQINGRGIWPEFLIGKIGLLPLISLSNVRIDYAFALLIGIIFQYFSIAPMSGDYGPKTIYRAAKADYLSLTFFEIRLFGWMAIFQIAIFDWKLQTNNVVYWWMMQVRASFRTIWLFDNIKLIEEVDWYVLGALDGVSYQLVVN